MVRFLAGLFSLTAALGWCPATARAATIDFESVPTSGCGDVKGLQLSTQGFEFLTGGDGAALFTCDSTDPTFASNDTNFLSAAVEASGGAGLNTPPIVVTEENGLSFSLLAFDASELAASILLPGEGVLVQAFDASDNLVAEQTFVFDGLIDGPGGIDDFETLVLPVSFQNVSSVWFQALDYDGLYARFSIDNLVVEVAEPQVPTLAPWAQLVLVSCSIGAGIGTWKWCTD